jgi:4-hydroxy-3-polyprenylbenzoate decarboxylase
VVIEGAIRLPLELGFRNPRLILAGILVIAGPPYRAAPGGTDTAVEKFCAAYDLTDPINNYPLVVIVDDSSFAARTLNNFLWTTFTRSNPASDIYGIDAFIRQKHWGCMGSLVIDARVKPHHAPPLVEDPKVTERVDALAAPGKPLHGII